MTAQQTLLNLRAEPPPDLSGFNLVTEGDARSWAAFGAGGSTVSSYRYALGRHWHDHGADRTPRWAVFVMLNPSTATFGGEENDDPTIRRCIGFAERELLSGIVVVNLFAFRSKNPRDLGSVADPIGGVKNLTVIRWALTHPHCKLAIAAWGRFPSEKVRALAAPLHTLVKHTLRPIDATGAFVPLHCLGLTKVEPVQPRHPLMLPANTPLVRWP